MRKVFVAYCQFRKSIAQTGEVLIVNDIKILFKLFPIVIVADIAVNVFPHSDDVPDYILRFFAVPQQ